jgi:K+-sensing histidine kinase KdpD
LVLVALVVLLKLAVPHLGTDAPFLLMLGPSVLAAWRGGFGPGIATAILGIAAVNYFFLEPFYDFRTSPVATFHSIVFATNNVTAASLTAAVRSARHRATAAQRDAQGAARRVDGLYHLTLALGGARRVEDVAEVILHETVAALRGTLVAVYVASSDDQTLRLVTYLGSDPGFLPLSHLTAFTQIPVAAEAPAALSARTRALVFTESEDEFRARFPAHAEAAQGNRLPAACLCAPMIVHDEVIGVLGIVFSDPKKMSFRDRSWAQAVAQACGMAVQRVRLHEQEHRARVAAEDAARIKDEFLFVVSTELRAPLTTIVGWAHLLRKTKPSERSRYEHALDVIERSAQAQARLVDDILDLARMTARRLSFEPGSTDLTSLMRAIVADHQVAAAAKGVQLEFLSAVEAVVVADAGRLRQAFEKVLANAFRFTPPGGHVTVEMARRRHCVAISVRDDGRGIPRGQVPHVLEAFRLGEDSEMRRERGLGLGLSIANFIVREHKGLLQVDSAGLGEGTTVTMELPLAEPVAGMVGVSADGARVGIAPLRGRRVLVVDDDTDAREALAELLMAEGAEVRALPSSDALDELRRFGPDVIVTDIDAERGQEFIRDVRGLPSPLSSIPALALIPLSRPEEGDATKGDGYERHLTKPPKPEALTAAINQMMR